MLIRILFIAVLALGIGNIGQFIWSKWQARSYQSQITKLENDLTAMQVEKSSREADLKDKKEELRVERKVIYVQKDVDKVVAAGDDARMRQLFIQHGMLAKDQNRPAKAN